MPGRFWRGQWKGTMGDVEGSSGAAQGAQSDEDRHERGFFGRIIGALSPPDADREGGDAGSAAPDAPVAVPRPGLGNLRRLRVEDVAVPRAEIASVPVDIGLKDLVEVFREGGFSRLPVYEGTPDSPLGMIHLKDLALAHGFNGGDHDFDLRAMLRPLLYVPPSMPLGVLLQKMQTDRRHMALVIDEYGGVDGLVTIEDLIEQVVGEIEDEHDVEEDRPWQREASGSYIVQSRAPLEEFEAEIGIPLKLEDEEDEVDTLGGLVFLLAGRVPARGEVIAHPEGPEFEVIDADPRRIKRLRVRLPQAQERP
jgi:magnesium and cobalt transporter